MQEWIQTITFNDYNLMFEQGPEFIGANVRDTLMDYAGPMPNSLNESGRRGYAPRKSIANTNSLAMIKHKREVSLA